LKNLPYNRSNLYTGWAIFWAALQHLSFMFLYRVLGKKTLKIMDKPLWKMYCEYDVFIMCTDEVDCVNGSSLKFSPLYISLLAKTLQKPIVFYANGTTRFTSEIWIWRLRTRRLWKTLAKYILSIVDLITVREEGTIHYFKQITGDKVPIYLTADPSFLLSSATVKRVKKIMLNEKIEKKEGPLIGVAMTYGVLSEAFISELDPATTYEKALKEIARFLDKLIEKFNSSIVFVPHSIEPYGYRDDRIVAKDIHRLMLNKNMTRVITREYSAEELKGLFGQLDLLITCRVHAAIGALSMGTPSCIIARPWDGRAYNIIGKMAKQEKWIYNVKNLNADKLFKHVSDLLVASSEIRKQLPHILHSVEEKALRNGKLLKALLNSRFKMAG
jgi:polysaccharide pyruvyl transferase WcaK-like protein